jgi:hypothetical protein
VLDVSCENGDARIHKIHVRHIRLCSAYDFNNNTKHTETGTCDYLHASAPKKILRIVDKLLTLELLYACASSYFLVTL